MTAKRTKSDVPRMPDAPTKSQYQCCVPDCQTIGVWSPYLTGTQWYCRFHAKLPEPKPHRQLTRSETIALMKSIFGRAADFSGGEDAAERAAIQAEADPL